jgi:hypothetical protein
MDKSIQAVSIDVLAVAEENARGRVSLDQGRIAIPAHAPGGA